MADKIYIYGNPNLKRVQALAASKADCCAGRLRLRHPDTFAGVRANARTVYTDDNAIREAYADAGVTVHPISKSKRKPKRG